MTDNQIIIEVSKLDGWIEPHVIAFSVRGYRQQPKDYPESTDISQLVPNYLTSRDAIIPVIEKQYKGNTQPTSFMETLWVSLNEQSNFFDEHGHTGMLFSTPKQLCIAFLKAMGN